MGLGTDFSVISLRKKISTKASSINKSQLELDRNYFAVLSALVGTQGFRKTLFVEAHVGTLCSLLWAVRCTNLWEFVFLSGSGSCSAFQSFMGDQETHFTGTQ